MFCLPPRFGNYLNRLPVTWLAYEAGGLSLASPQQVIQYQGVARGNPRQVGKLVSLFCPRLEELCFMPYLFTFALFRVRRKDLCDLNIASAGAGLFSQGTETSCI